MYEKERRKRRVIGFGLKISLSTMKGETICCKTNQRRRKKDEHNIILHIEVPKQIHVPIYNFCLCYSGKVYTDILFVVSATNKDVGSAVSDALLQVIQFGL